MACPIVAGSWTPINLTEKFPGYRILDRNAPEYQLEAFIYTCVMLLFYTVATGAFMVKLILQAKEPWETSDTESCGAASELPTVVKIREQERRRKLVEREARRDVKMRMIKQLKQMGAIPGHNSAIERRTSATSNDTQTTSFSSSDQRICGGARRISMSGANLMQRRGMTYSNNEGSPILPLLWKREKSGTTFSRETAVWSFSPVSVHQPRAWSQASLSYTVEGNDDTLVVL